MKAENCKPGDIVICINSGKLDNSSIDTEVYLTLGKSYTIQNTNYMTYVNDSETNTIRIKNDKDSIFGYYADRFSTLKELRKEKLLKLKKL